MSDFMREEQYRARRDYTCHLCGGMIRAGTEYIYVVSKYEGRLNDYRRHIHCDALLNAWAAETGACEFSEYEIGEYLYDEVCRSCGLRETDGCAEVTAFSCDAVLTALLNASPTLLTAARESARVSKEGEA